MTNQKVRAILAITVVVGVFLMTAIIIIGGGQDSIKTMKEFSGVFTGLIGTIIGYYFGKKDT